MSKKLRAYDMYGRDLGPAPWYVRLWYWIKEKG